MLSRTLLALSLCLALGGCWQSDVLLLDPAAGVRALPDGTWVKVGEAPTEPQSIVWKGGGWYELQDEGDIVAFTLTPLGTIGGRQAYAGAMAEDGCQNGNNDDCEWDYGVVFVENGQALVAAPDCKKTAALAQEFGAAPAQGGDVCSFSSGDRLKAALAEFAKAPGKLDRYVKR
ncbi:hypothetical protein QO010_003295 [Caulobacter ginsengisoli]|uniref:Lipoprotein n=1 Tax=Caulobacter ginsengisoli TaxID=400775 RepID=A0ABU0IU16_9CAUL|nr:hypothetical protein [Caulobacter ginsengisoli]MDQ0465506.1 hypothetical protein [Caulobacter ginsengisoli]